MISNSNKSPLNLLLLINQPEVEAAVWRQKGKEGGEGRLGEKCES